ncbi:cobalamin biosynthesis protein CbiG [Deltaproteobacteria bacterium Smac51]|nr:cobalamin biosynthesis protein CbiG [Deltaproteobacteria bacterium Smac51]
MKSFAVYALTAPGASLAARIARDLPSARAELFLPGRLCPEFEGAAQPFEKLGTALAENFGRFSGHIVVGATGLVVRLIAPLLVSKKDDPAVVVLGQDGRFVVSLLSGHLGGGNSLAQEVARLTGGQAVVSTATDIAGCPALEVLARDLNMEIDDFSRLAAVSRSLVEGTRVKVHDPHLMLAPNLAEWPGLFEINGPPPAEGEPHIRVDFQTAPEDAAALTLRPRVLALGLGCHRGIDRAEVEELIALSLAEAFLSPKSVSILATVETRSEEPAFLEISRNMNRPLKIFTKAELSRVNTPNPSSKVLERIGVASVCEAAAMLAARADRLKISKRKSARATLAAALSVWR